MKKCVRITSALFVFLAASAFANVTVTSPSNGSTVGTSVKFTASATASTCSKGVASMGIYPSPYQLAYTVGGASLNTSLNLNPGTYNVVVEEWDNCGGATTSTVKITVKSGGTTGVYVTSPANNSTVGSGQGCRHNGGVGAILAGAGLTDVSSDGLVLTASNLPSPPLGAGRSSRDGPHLGGAASRGRGPRSGGCAHG